MEEYLFTFCGVHPQGLYSFVSIRADSYEEARKVMFAFYSDKWGFQYPANKRSELENCGMVEIPLGS